MLVVQWSADQSLRIRCSSEGRMRTDAAHGDSAGPILDHS